MKPGPRPLPAALAALSLLGLVIPACRPPSVPNKEKSLPPAYTSNQITDPALRKIAEQIKTWAAEQTGDGQKPLYSRTEVLPPVPTVQPYGVGMFQQEVRLAVILTTGPGWSGMDRPKKEAAVAEAFHHIQDQLKSLDHEPALLPTLTVQTPQGIGLTWINHLDPAGYNVHGND